MSGAASELAFINLYNLREETARLRICRIFLLFKTDPSILLCDRISVRSGINSIGGGTFLIRISFAWLTVSPSLFIEFLSVTGLIF